MQLNHKPIQLPFDLHRSDKKSKKPQNYRNPNFDKKNRLNQPLCIKANLALIPC